MSSASKAIDFCDLPAGAAPQPISIPHFPSPLFAVIWRNWDVIPLPLLAKTLQGTPDQVQEIAQSMGLPAQREISPQEIKRNYMTVLHRNWHLLPYEQLCQFLNWTPGRMLFGLNEDDFMWAKLGGYKPQCDAVRYSPPSASELKRAQEIASILAQEVPAASQKDEPPFGFIRRFDQIGSPVTGTAKGQFEIRMVYPYFLRYGDPLMGDGVDDIPDGYLAELAASGINAIWMQAVLNTLAPWDLAPDISLGWPERLGNLKRLVHRCRSFGIDVFLYLNEPRAMPRAFYDAQPELRGVEEMPTRAQYNPDVVALCLSTEAVREFLVNSVRHIFEHVPDLGGILALTYSENLTNCYSRTYPQKGPDGLRRVVDPTSNNPRNDARNACPRCLERGPEQTHADVCALLEEGMRQAGSKGKLLLYLWSTPAEWIPGILDRLPKSIWALCISEWGTPFRRGDYAGTVNEYSISIVGPSEQSKRQWHQAHERGLRTAAKMQAANTYEFSSIPYIPALRLVAEHLSNLVAAEVEGLMLGWTAGGSPSPNLELIKVFAENPTSTVTEALLTVARQRFGEKPAEAVVQAWNLLSDAFAEFPFDISVCYAAPQSLGPANLLYAENTGFKSTMVTFPFDDLDTWRGPYTSSTLQAQFEEVARQWEKGVNVLAALRTGDHLATLEDEWRIARAALLHFQSTANQIHFVRIRHEDTATAARILEDEIRLARELYSLARQDSRLGFEATNHYGYIPSDLVEKILNCRNLLDHFSRR